MRPIDADALYETLCHIWDRSDSEEFEQAVFESIANAPTIDQPRGNWIPCSERLPETAEEVLVYLFGGDPYLAWFDGDEWQTNDFTVDDDERPTAWMPLPEEWKGEE